jgi:hypothetical protein
LKQTISWADQNAKYESLPAVSHEYGTWFHTFQKKKTLPEGVREEVLSKMLGPKTE